MVAVQVTRREFTPVVVPGQEISQRYHVNAKRPLVSNGYCMRNVCDFESRVFYQHEVYLEITRYDMSQSSCKRDKK